MEGKQLSSKFETLEPELDGLLPAAAMVCMKNLSPL
jgi:hypothetical protein